MRKIEAVKFLVDFCWLGRLKEAAFWTKSGHRILANLGQFLGAFVACLI